MRIELLAGREALRRQGFSQLLGAELDALAPETEEISLPLRDAVRQHDGYVHGGVLAYSQTTPSPSLGARCWERC